MVDRIFPLKQESVASGGGEDDVIMSPMDPLEDALLAKEVFIIADETNPRTDTVQQGIKADPAYNIVLYDRHNASGVKLSDIVNWVDDIKDEDDMASNSATHLVTQQSLVAYVTSQSGTDEKVKVSANDTTANYLISKLTAGTNITITETNDGGNETVTIGVDISSSGVRYPVKFGYNGNANSGRDLEFHHGASSEDRPFTFDGDHKLVGISLASDSNETVSFDVYKNGTTLLENFSLTAQDYKITTGLNHSLVSGDKIHATVNSGAMNDPVLVVWVVPL